jgi:hypothetical protein
LAIVICAWHRYALPVSTQWGVLTPQLTPHAPHALGVLSAASQPLFGFPSQLPKPVAQLGVQTRLPALPVHAVVPLEFVHCTLQAPQAATVLSCVSQPGEAVQSP